MAICAVTGATGLVGGNLVVELTRLGHQVVCTRRASSRAEHLSALPITWATAPLEDAHALAAAFAGADVVFHCAAQVSLRKVVTPELIAANVDGTRHVVQAVRRAGVKRLVHCSSAAALALAVGGRGARDVTEDDPWNLDSLGLDDGYATTKYEGQSIVLAATRDGLDAVVVNPTYMFGPLDAKLSSGRIVVDVARRRVPALAPGDVNIVDVRDVCRGMVAAWMRGRAGEKYILGGENTTWADTIRRIARLAGVRPPRLVPPWPVARLAGFVGDMHETITGREGLFTSAGMRWSYCKGSRLSSAKAMHELGYAPGPVDDGIRAALAWFQAHGVLDAR